MVTRRCWVPSCRSRSIRRRSASPAAMMRTCDAARSSYRSWSSSSEPLVVDREPHRRDDRADQAGVLEQRLVVDERGQRVRRQSPSMSVTARPAPGLGRSLAGPSCRRTHRRSARPRQQHQARVLERRRSAAARRSGSACSSRPIATTALRVERVRRMPAANDAAATPRVTTTTTKSSSACTTAQDSSCRSTWEYADLHRDCDAQREHRREASRRPAPLLRRHGSRCPRPRARKRTVTSQRERVLGRVVPAPVADAGELVGHAVAPGAVRRHVEEQSCQRPDREERRKGSEQEPTAARR